MTLTDKIHLLRIDFEIPLGPDKKLKRFVNVLLIFGDSITLIDTGVKGSEAAIFRYIGENGRRPSEIGTVILSHSHPDHIGAAHAIKELTHCNILAHKGEADWIEDIAKQNRERPVPAFFTLVDHPVTIDEQIEHGRILKVAPEVTLEILHAPGHSKGSLNILFKEDRILFTADSIPLKNDIPNYDNYRDLIASLAVIKADTRFTTLLTSWTPPLRTAAEIAAIIDEGEMYIRTVDAAVKSSYIGTEPEPFTFCKAAINKLGLPPFLATPIVDRAFRSHLSGV
jgi:glyoxylase-like metal-dependent hydrolase (beta-lactamase superfamily II)